MNRNQQQTGRNLESAAEAHLESCGWQRVSSCGCGGARWVHPRVKSTEKPFPTWDALTETRANPHIKW